MQEQESSFQNSIQSCMKYSHLSNCFLATGIYTSDDLLSYIYKLNEQYDELNQRECMLIMIKKWLFIVQFFADQSQWLQQNNTNQQYKNKQH